MIEWTSIHDQLPKEGQMVLIFMRGHISLRIFEENGFHCFDDDYYTPLLMKNGITHWASVEPPK